MRTAVSQGLCDTTATERFVPVDCKCPTYPWNLGPCAGFEDNGLTYCTYCDHLPECHELKIVLKERSLGWSRMTEQERNG